MSTCWPVTVCRGTLSGIVVPVLCVPLHKVCKQTLAAVLAHLMQVEEITTVPLSH